MNPNCFDDKHTEHVTPSCTNANFIAPNPVTSFNKEAIHPTIHPSAYVGPFSAIIGDVTLCENVFVAPNVSIRADEGTPFFIDRDTNIQDGTIMHALQHGRIIENGKEYSIYIGKRVSCAHKCLIHGPCKIEDDVFIGFNSTVFNSKVSRGCYISSNALITNGVTIAPNRFIPAGAIIDTQLKANRLACVTPNKKGFIKGVQDVNLEFPSAYKNLCDSNK